MEKWTVATVGKLIDNYCYKCRSCQSKFSSVSSFRLKEYIANIYYSDHFKYINVSAISTYNDTYRYLDNAKL